MRHVMKFRCAPIMTATFRAARKEQPRESGIAILAEYRYLVIYRGITGRFARFEQRRFAFPAREGGQERREITREWTSRVRDEKFYYS